MDNKGPSFMALLLLLFIGLKLTGSITWSWWWVLLPFWGPIVLTVVVAIYLAIYFPKTLKNITDR